VTRSPAQGVLPCLHWVAHSRPNNYFVISTQARRLWLTHWDSCTYAPVLSPRLDTFLRYKKSVIINATVETVKATVTSPVPATQVTRASAFRRQMHIKPTNKSG
jgi:hypothetical protein